MAVTKVEIRCGVYHDSLVLMGLQVSLQRLPGVLNAGVMMGLPTNKDLLRQKDLLTKDAEAALPDDLIISIKGENETAAQRALDEVDNLLSHRQKNEQQDYRPKSIEAAARILPNSAWVLISVPGLYAAGAAREALRLKKNVFLFSDNVTLKDEISLKQEASERGLLLMGPDCGTAIVHGTGFGFANDVRQGPIGLVGASGTGLQLITTRIHQLGSGITHAIGTGGRDLCKEVGGITARQGLGLLQRDPETKVIVLISKRPAPEVATTLLRYARKAGKPVVINFIGHPTPVKHEKEDDLYFTSSLDEAAEIAVELATSTANRTSAGKSQTPSFTDGQLYLRGLFSGGTLAQESLLILQNYLAAINSNISSKEENQFCDLPVSQGHAILDLGEDKFTMGRPHPMLDNSSRLERLRQEADDPGVAVILIDVMLGHGAHPDPASELAPAISEARSQARKDGRMLEIVAVVVGTDGDPQDFTSQVEQLQNAGARVETSISAACAYVGRRLQSLVRPAHLPAVDLSVLQKPVQAINVGLESFAASISAQNASILHVDWRPPAGGNEKLISILGRMKKYHETQGRQEKD